MSNDIEHVFICLLFILFCEYFFQILSPFLSYSWDIEILYRLDSEYNSLVRYMHFKYILISSLKFHFLNAVFQREDISNFNEV